MKDYNFFEEYVFKSNKAYLGRLVIPFVFMIIFGSVIGLFVYNLSVINDLNTQHEENYALINSTKYINTMAELEETKAELALMQAIQAETDVFKLMIASDYVVTEEITEMIVDSIPRNVAFNTYSITSSGVDISGIATDYSYVAELERNLRNLNRFSNIFVSTISVQDGDEEADEVELVSFSINLSIGGESND